MRWGISTLLIKERDLLSNVHLLVELGIELLEIRAEPGHFPYEDREYINSLGTVLKKVGLKAYSLHMPTNKVDISYLNQDDRLRSIREIKRAALSFLKLGGELVVVHPGGRVKDEFKREDHLSRSFESLKELGDFFSGCGLKMALENTLPSRIGSRIEELLILHGRLKSKNSGICLDTGHINIMKDPTVALKELKDYLIHLHIADNLGENDDHFLPGEGKINWKVFFKILKEIDYQGVFMLEVKRRGELPEMLQRIKEVRGRLS